MRLAFRNYIRDSILLASSTETGRDVEDLKIPHLTRSFAFGTSSGNITMDLGEERNITCFVLGGTNLNSGDTITLEANTSNEWTTPAFTSSVGYYGQHSLLFLDETYQYWRIVVSSTVDSLKIGHIFIGQYLQLPGIDPNFDMNYNRTDSLTMSVGMQPYGDIGYEHFNAKITFPFVMDRNLSAGNLTLPTRHELLDMWNEVGGTTPCYLILWEMEMEIDPPIFGILNQSKLTFKKETKDNQTFYKCEINWQETR